MGGFFTGAVRWVLGRLGSPPTQAGGGVCATLSVVPRVVATLSVKAC